MASKTMNKNMFTFLSDSDNKSDMEINVEKNMETDNKEQITKNNSTIIPFKGVECVPLKSVKNISSPTQPKVLNLPNKSKKERKNNTITFIAGNSYISQKRHELAQSQKPIYHTSSDDPRTAAFKKMEDKETLAKSLSCTRACNNVLQKQENNQYGICFRHICTFAHSLEELNDPMCQFDTTCRFQYGTVDQNHKCMFRHSNETRGDWLKRTGQKLPDLPPTSEKTRKPTPKVTPPKVTPPKVVKALGSGYYTKTNLTTPANKINLTTPTTPRKNAWNNPNPIVTSISKKLDLEDSDIISNKSRSSEYDRRKSSTYHNHSRSSESVYASSKMHVIRVPTEELAKIAIHAAFDRGTYDIQVIVDK